MRRWLYAIVGCALVGCASGADDGASTRADRVTVQAGVTLADWMLCQDLEGGSGWSTLKVAPGAPGTYASADGLVEVRIEAPPGPMTTFSWSLSGGGREVVAVAVRGATGHAHSVPTGSVYRYDPPASAGTGLSAFPTAIGIPFVLFCYRAETVDEGGEEGTR